MPGTNPAQPDWTLERTEKVPNNGLPVEALMLRFHFLRNGKRILPRFELFAEQYRNLSLALQKISEQHGSAVPEDFKVMILVPEGLKEIKEDREWKAAIDLCNSLDWMDREVKILVEV